MGSVKDLEIIVKPTKTKIGTGRFHFSDRYSVFDWGEMPDHIPHKGAAIAILGAYFFERLEEKGILTHYNGLVEGGKPKKLSDIKKPSNIMDVKLLRVIKPEVKDGGYDYSSYERERNGFLIPLEVIYRNFLPEGSSVFRRLKAGEVKLEDLGLKSMPLPGQRLEKPILDVSTKLERTDRYLSWNEAGSISGLSNREMLNLKRLTSAVNEIITKEFSKIGLVNEDGKMEFGFDMKRHFILVDVLGTLDECRFTYDGLPVSKEVARIFYRNTKWYSAVEEAKKKDRQNWKEICKLNPPVLPKKLKDAISNIYCACTNEITQREWFKNTPSLRESLKDIREVLKL